MQMQYVGGQPPQQTHQLARAFRIVDAIGVLAAEARQVHGIARVPVAAQVLADGDQVPVKFSTADKGCVWNFKIEWADPGYPGVVWQNIDLCKIDEITLKYDRATDKTTAVVK